MKHIIIGMILVVNSLFASIGEVTALRGEATLARTGTNKPISVGTKLEEHDAIMTGVKSKLQIVFNDKTVISLGQKSSLKVDEYLFDKDNSHAKFSVGKGFFKSITGRIGKINHKRFKIKTSNATIGVRGTTVIAEVQAKRDIIACSSGQIVVSNAGGSTIVNAGERTIVEAMKMPKQAQKINHVLMQSLDNKSDPSKKDKAPTPAKIEHTDSKDKKNLEDVKNEKLKEKFEPWIEEKPAQTLQDIKREVGTQTPTYHGKITQGSTSLGGAINSDTSKVNLGFDLGTGAMQGDISFKDTSSDYHMNVAGKVKGDGSFSFSDTTGFDGSGKGALSGKKFQEANGEMHFSEKHIDGRINNINATFKTKR